MYIFDSKLYFNRYAINHSSNQINEKLISCFESADKEKKQRTPKYHANGNKLVNYDRLSSTWTSISKKKKKKSHSECVLFLINND